MVAWAQSINAFVPGHLVPDTGNRAEKKWTPAITAPQIRQGSAVILYEALQCGTMAHMLQERQKRLQRHELARFYPHKLHDLLAPLNLYKRQF